jgi:hypothetical protein
MAMGQRGINPVIASSMTTPRTQSNAMYIPRCRVRAQNTTIEFDPTTSFDNFMAHGLLSLFGARDNVPSVLEKLMEVIESPCHKTI